MDADEPILGSQSLATAAMAEAGDWLTGSQRLDVWAEVRDAGRNPLDQERRSAVSPYAVDGSHQATELLSEMAMEVTHRVASDPGRLTRSWAEKAIAELGEETYTELVGVTSVATVVDTLDDLLGEPVRPLPLPADGEPGRLRPEGVGDIGAWVSQSVDKQRANVSRALSLVPLTNGMWRSLVSACYSRGAEFLELEWDRHLTRPQVELTAARTTTLNECFY